MLKEYLESFLTDDDKMIIRDAFSFLDEYSLTKKNEETKETENQMTPDVGHCTMTATEMPEYTSTVSDKFEEIVNQKFPSTHTCNRCCSKTCHHDCNNKCSCGDKCKCGKECKCGNKCKSNDEKSVNYQANMFGIHKEDTKVTIEYDKGATFLYIDGNSNGNSDSMKRIHVHYSYIIAPGEVDIISSNAIWENETVSVHIIFKERPTNSFNIKID